MMGDVEGNPLSGLLNMIGLQQSDDSVPFWQRHPSLQLDRKIADKKLEEAAANADAQANVGALLQPGGMQTAASPQPLASMMPPPQPDAPNPMDAMAAMPPPAAPAPSIPLPQPRPDSAPQMADALPAAAMPTSGTLPPLPPAVNVPTFTAPPTQSEAPAPAAPSAAVPESSLLGRLQKTLYENRNALLMAGAGFAGAQTFGQGMSKAFSNAATGAQLDEKSANGNLTVQYLVKRGMDEQTARSVASNPALLQSTLATMNKSPMALAAGSRLVDPQTGREIVGSKEPEKYVLTKMDDGSLVATNPINPSESQVVRAGPPFRPITPDERTAFGIPANVGAAMGPDGKPIAIGGASTTVNMPSPEKARDQKIGEAQGSAIGDDIKAGQSANKRLQALAILDQASKTGGDDLSSGPFAKAVLSMKQGMSEITGRDYAGMAPTEVAQKVGFDLATQAAKAITNRPSQAEFIKAIENVPGIFMSGAGRRAMTSLLAQEARSDIELGKLANKKENWESWPQAKQDYYDQHQLISPFTGKPFGQQDIQMLVDKAPADQNVKRSDAGQAPRVAADGKTYIPDPNRPGKYLLQVQ